jgi:hypothetical protein
LVSSAFSVVVNADDFKHEFFVGMVVIRGKKISWRGIDAIEIELGGVYEIWIVLGDSIVAESIHWGAGKNFFNGRASGFGLVTNKIFIKRVVIFVGTFNGSRVIFSIVIGSNVLFFLGSGYIDLFGEIR